MPARFHPPGDAQFPFHIAVIVALEQTRIQNMEQVEYRDFRGKGSDFGIQFFPCTQFQVACERLARVVSPTLEIEMKGTFRSLRIRAASTSKPVSPE